MRAIARFVLSAALLAFLPATASATWSVIALDAKTGQVIIASATCVRQAGFPQRTPNGSRDLMDVQAVIVPGLGVAACQAGVDNTRRNQMLVYNEIQKGTPPAQIIELLKKDPDVERRQFGIVMMPQGDTVTARNNRAGFNGSGNSQSSLYWGGQVGDVYYQVQGNTLLGDQVVTMAALAFTRASGTMADRVMAAMEAADRYGGDHRCNCGNDPLDPRPVRRQDRARRLHRHRREGRCGRRHAQRRQVLRLPQRQRRRHQGRRERQPGEDAADALRRLEEGGGGRTAPPGPTPYKPAP